MVRRRRTIGCGPQFVILLVVVAALAYVGYDYFQASRIRSQNDLLAALPELGALPAAESPAAESTPAAQAAAPQGASVIPVSQTIDSSNTRLFIPSAGIEAPITQVFLDDTGSWDVSYLGTSVGHLQGTAWLDDVPGNIVLSGHVELSDGRQGVFATLDDVEEGEILIISRGEEERRYIVREVREVEPDDLTPLYPTTDVERVTLITCGDYNFFSNEYEVRTVVVADRVL